MDLETIKIILLVTVIIIELVVLFALYHHTKSLRKNDKNIDEHVTHLDEHSHLLADQIKKMDKHICNLEQAQRDMKKCINGKNSN